MDNARAIRQRDIAVTGNIICLFALLLTKLNRTVKEWLVLLILKFPPRVAGKDLIGRCF